MGNRSETFGRLLKGAINSIATYEGKTAPIIEEELAEQVGLAGSAIQRYKAGSLPPDPRTIEIIAEAAVRRGLFSREWLQRFLHAARYHQADQLLDHLCPLGPARPRPPRVYQNLPAPTYSQFVMRAEAFAEVLDGLSKRSAAVIIVGLGGNGKTSLAREVADACLKDENSPARFDAAVWVSDKDRPGTTNLSIVLDEIARTLDYPGFTQFEHDEKRREVEQLLRRQRVLVCLDNVETITDGALIAWLLNLPEPSKTLITTREYRREYRRGGWPVELRGMSDSEAWQLIHERARLLKIDQLIGAPDQVEPLLAATGGNPKALTITLGLLKYERRPLQQVVDDLYAARGELFDDLFDRAWALLDEAARRVLLVMTFFPASASAEAISATADAGGFAFNRAVERLADLALLDAHHNDLSSPPRYSLHPLVKAFAAKQLNDAADFEYVARLRWLRWYSEFSRPVGYCWDDPSRLNILDSESNNILTAFQWSFDHGKYKETIELAKGIGYYYYIRGMSDPDLSIDIVAAQAAEFLGDTNETVRRLAYYIHSMIRQGHYDKMEAAFCKMAVLEPSLADEIRFVYLHACGRYYLTKGNLNLARQHWRQALGITNKLSVAERDLACRWLAISYMHAKEYEQSQRLLLDALVNAERNDIQLSVMFCKREIAAIELELRHIDRATALLKEAQEIAEYFQDRSGLAEIKRLFAKLYLLIEDQEAARRTIVELIDLYERLGMRRKFMEAREELRRLDEMGEAPAA